MMNNNENIEVKEAKKDKKSRELWGFPLFSWILLALAALALVVMLAYNLSEGFANFYNRYPAAFLRGIFAQISGILPCSIAEAFIIFSPFLLVAIIIYANKHFVDSWRSVGKFLIITLSVASLFFSTFALNFGAGYHTSSVDKLLELDRRDVSAEELRETAEILVEEINKYAGKLSVKSSGSSVMPPL
jgi:hypothetical protein